MKLDNMNLEDLLALKKQVEEAISITNQQKVDNLPKPYLEKYKDLSSKVEEKFIVEALIPCRVKIKVDDLDNVSAHPMDDFFKGFDIEEIPFTKSSSKEIEAKYQILQSRLDDYDDFRRKLEKEFQIDLRKITKMIGL